jgi:hypothetical protein
MPGVTNIKDGFGVVGSIWAMTFRTLRRYPVIIVPFLIIALLEAIVLTLAYLAPRSPLSAILAPPIRALFHYPFGSTGSGEAFLHYPINFLLLPRLLYIGQIIIGATVGAVMTALAVRMISQANEGLRPTWGINLRDGIFRYFTLLIFWGVIFFLETAASRGLPRFFSSHLLKQLIFYLSLGIVVLVETFFAYGVAAIMLENQRTWRAILRTLSVAGRTFLPTLILVFVPLLFQILFVFIGGKIPQLMVKFFPEITLFILGASILVTFITDCILRTSTVILFLVKKDTERAG